MWPQALQMSKEECRGVLRRLELESYSNVISVFRAQGGLTDAKAKLLEELRGIFHVSQERHRAEARRVANDEQLATIAEAISGPNTWQEWSREGRRSFPLLPRVAPQTALALIANNVAKETMRENAKLLNPAETAEVFAKEQRNLAVKRENGIKSIAPVVTSDPFKMPEIPTMVLVKKNLKRNLSDAAAGQSAVSKKRVITNSEIIANKQSAQKQVTKPYQHITASSASGNHKTAIGQNTQKKSQKLRNATASKSKAAIKKLAAANAIAAQQQKLNATTTQSETTTTTNVSITTPVVKRQATPAKCGRRAQKSQQQQQRKQLKLQMPGLEIQSSNEAQHSPQINYEGQQQLNQQHQGNQHEDIQQQEEQQQQQQLEIPQQQNKQQMIVMDLPQMPVGKKDISKTMTKVQKQNSSNSSAAIMLSPVGTVITTSPAVGAIAPMPISNCKVLNDKPAVRPTAIQKYIIDERQPQQMSSLSSSTSILPSQIITLPQLSSSAMPLRAATSNAVTTTLGTKIIVKNHVQQALQTSPTRATSMMEPIEHDGIESKVEGPGEATTTVAKTLLTMPSTALQQHAPTAVIQVSGDTATITSAGTNTPQQQSFEVGNVPLPTLAKVPARKLMPIVLSALPNVSSSVGNLTVHSGATGGSGIMNITKLETLNNGATIIGGNPTITGSAIIKNLSAPSTMLISAANQSGGATISGINTIAPQLPVGSTAPAGVAATGSIMSSGTVFRKQTSGIIKTGIIGMGSCNILSSTSVTTKTILTTSTSNSRPQIISNIKLTSATHSPIVAAATTAATQQQQQQLPQQPQQFLKTVPSTGIRTPVKICQSANGKVFIQPANKLSPISQSKFFAGSAGTLNAVIPQQSQQQQQQQQHQQQQKQRQRIAIQKVQIIPAPGSGSGLITTQTKPPTSTIAISSGQIGGTTSTAGGGGSCGQKFLMTRPHTSGPITITKSGSVFTSLITKVQQQQPKSNVVVIGAAPLQPQSLHMTTSKDMLNLNDVGTSLKSSPMITEDTPVDILNAPITLSETETSSDMITVTDWELELDQATAASKASEQHHRQQHHNLIRVENKFKKSANSKFPITSNILSTTPSALTSTSTTSLPTTLSTSLPTVALSASTFKSKSLPTTLSRSFPTSQPITIVDNATVFLDDCFEDVIVEEHDESGDDMQCEMVKESNEQEDVGITDKSACQTVVQGTEVTTSKQLTSGEFDNADAGFDETIADYTETDDDENTAVEYIEGEPGEEIALTTCTILTTPPLNVNEKFSASNGSTFAATKDGSSCSKKNALSAKDVETNKLIEYNVLDVNNVTMQNDIDLCSSSSNSGNYPVVTHNVNDDAKRKSSVSNETVPVAVNNVAVVAAQNKL